MTLSSTLSIVANVGQSGSEWIKMGLSGIYWIDKAFFPNYEFSLHFSSGFLSKEHNTTQKFGICCAKWCNQTQS